MAVVQLLRKLSLLRSIYLVKSPILSSVDSSFSRSPTSVRLRPFVTTAIFARSRTRDPEWNLLPARSCYSNDASPPSSEDRNYLVLTDEELMKQCDMSTFKASGPGGQHRNKRESAVRLKHLPTGIIAQAVEDRSQHKNRASALLRLRTLLALKGCASIVGSAVYPRRFCF